MKNSKASKIQVMVRISDQRATDELKAEAEVLESFEIKGTQVKAYKITISFRDSTHKELIYTDNVELIKERIVHELKQILNELNPTVSHIEVIDDPYKLMAFQAGYCQHCGKKLLESYGPVTGILKKCPGCRKVSFIRHRR
jgi:hypothetical protein